MDNYFNIEQASLSDGSSACYTVKTGHKAFTKGHFPKEPILPAYALSLLASECLSQYGGKHFTNSYPLKNFKISASKFVFPVDPRKQIFIKIFISENSEQAPKVELRISQEEKLCTTLFYRPIS